MIPTALQLSPIKRAIWLHSVQDQLREFGFGVDCIPLDADPDDTLQQSLEKPFIFSVLKDGEPIAEYRGNFLEVIGQLFEEVEDTIVIEPRQRPLTEGYQPQCNGPVEIPKKISRLPSAGDRPQQN